MNVLFDPREGNLRDTALGGAPNNVTLAGTLHYVELDINNLARWFTGGIGASGANANNLTGYTLYFSDRRGDRKDPTPPPSIGSAVPAKAGGFGYDDIANGVSAPLTGCPNGAFDQGEDLEDDFNNNGVGLSPALRVWGYLPDRCCYVTQQPLEDWGHCHQFQQRTQHGGRKQSQLRRTG